MKIRSDCAFANLSDDKKMFLLEMAEGETLVDLAERVWVEFKIETSVSSLRRFLCKLRRELVVMDAKAAEGSLAELAELGKNSKAREAALETARQKLCDLAVATEGKEELVEVLRSLGEEKAREHELAMRERAMAVAEENAKIGRRKLELQEARSALRLLPVIRTILTDGEMAAEERVARARDVLMVGGGQLLIPATVPVGDQKGKR